MEPSMSTGAADVAVSDATDNATSSSCGKAPRKALAVSKGAPRKTRTGQPRPPARPHRKLHGDILSARIKDLEKKLTVLRSRIVILDDRLEAYKREDGLRLDTA